MNASLTCFARPEEAALPLHCAGPEALDGIGGRIGAVAETWLRASGFTGKANQVALLPDPGGGLVGAVVGTGAAEASSPWIFGGLPMGLPVGTTWRLADPTHAAAAALGWGLGAYRFDRFRAAGRPPARLVLAPGTEKAVIAVEAAWRVRDLVNMPASHLGPAELAQAVVELAAANGARASVIEGAALEQGFPALAVVGAASPRAPRVAMLEWGAADAPLVALCGKGVCFDTGGLDLKPAGPMLRMKKDMGGAALVLGVAEMVMRLRLPVRLLVLVGAVENAVAGNAFRPGDVLQTRAGLTVEVGNTDAEGRLVLCDLLAFAGERRPVLMIDCATLTGAARVALGPDLPALFTDDDTIADLLIAAGAETHDPVWRLPLHQGYAGWLDSQVADLNNVSSKPMAGATIGALFLKRFVPEGVPWAHLDVYAWNDSTRPGRPEGGEAQAMRALTRLISRHAGCGHETGE
jgi:leucyl aminopeptidase